MKLCLSASSFGLLTGCGAEDEVSEQSDALTFESAAATSLELGTLLDAESLKVCQAWSAWETSSQAIGRQLGVQRDVARIDARNGDLRLSYRVGQRAVSLG